MPPSVQLTLAAAQPIADAHDLGPILDIAIVRGSVNTNAALTTAEGRFFLRVYEAQGAEEVAWEWEVQDHLSAQGLPVPRRIRGPATGALRLEGHPVGIFTAASGAQRRPSQSRPTHLRALGEALGRIHRETQGWPSMRRNRFDAAALSARLRSIRTEGRADLTAEVDRLEAVAQGWDPRSVEGAPQGVVHGDLFFDNVIWEGDRIAAVLDWDSAFTGPLLYDVVTTALAWSWRGSLDLERMGALLAGYRQSRPLAPGEAEAALPLARLACARFATTRILDFRLQDNQTSHGFRDHRRFMARLAAVEALGARGLAALIEGREG